jgi:hypothetical protein
MGDLCNSHCVGQFAAIVFVVYVVVLAVAVWLSLCRLGLLDVFDHIGLAKVLRILNVACHGQYVLCHIW